MKDDLEQSLLKVYTAVLEVSERECIHKLSDEINAYVTVFGINKDQVFHRALIKYLLGGNMEKDYKGLIQALIYDIRESVPMSFERKEALIKLKEAHMWVKAALSRGSTTEVSLTEVSPTEQGSSNGV